jgi:O-antigen/teichoic acid export membrane protein
MSNSHLRRLVTRGYHESVVRRSFLLLFLLGPAFAINLVLYYAAAALLSPESFGLFYIAITTANLLYSGSFILNVFCARYLVFVAGAAGEAAAGVARNRLQLLISQWGAAGALAAILALFGVGKWIGVQSWAIVILIVLDAYSAYVIDINRAFLQSLRRTLPLGAVTLGWTILRFLLGIAGMAWFGTAWGGMLGVVLAAVLVLVAFYFFMPPTDRDAAQSYPELPSLSQLAPVVVGYVSLIAVSNLDVLLTYLLLADNALGTYSASSVFPKGILVLVTPVLQMLYPLMVGHEKAPPNVRVILQKSSGVILLLASALALGIFLFDGLLCGGAWGLKLCQPRPLGLLLISAVTLSVLRVLVLYQSARGRDWMALSMLLPAAVYVWVAMNSSHLVDTIALEFMAFSAALLLYYGGLTVLAERR